MTAFDTIAASKLRAFLTTLGIIIGVLAVILLVALGQGVRQYIGDTFASLGANVLQVTPGKRDTKGGLTPPVSGVAHKLTSEDAQAIARRVFAANGVSGVVQGTASMRYLGMRRDSMALGVGEQFADIRNMHVNAGRFFTEEDVAAHRRYAVIGRTVQVELFGDQNPLGQTIKINDAEFRVVGILEHKGNSLGFDFDDWRGADRLRRRRSICSRSTATRSSWCAPATRPTRAPPPMPSPTCWRAAATGRSTSRLFRKTICSPR